jgi:isopentenyl phosphate kinase
MAIPSLQHQIEFVDTILIMKAISVDGNQKYVIQEILKSKYTPLMSGDLVKADFSIFELMGYNVSEGQEVVAFLAIRRNLIDYDCIDFLPVINGVILYGKDDQSVEDELNVDKLRALTSCYRDFLDHGKH